MQKKTFCLDRIEVILQLRGKDESMTITMGDSVFPSKQQLPPHVRIWDSVTLNTLHVIGVGFFDRAVTCIAFSKSVSMGPVGTGVLVPREERISSRLKREEVNTRRSRLGARTDLRDETVPRPRSPHSEVTHTPSGRTRDGQRPCNTGCMFLGALLPALALNFTCPLVGGPSVPPSFPHGLPVPKQELEGTHGLPGPSGCAHATDPPYKPPFQKLNVHTHVHVLTSEPHKPQPQRLCSRTASRPMFVTHVCCVCRGHWLLQEGVLQLLHRLVLIELMRQGHPRPLSAAPVPPSPHIHLPSPGDQGSRSPKWCMHILWPKWTPY